MKADPRMGMVDHMIVQRRLAVGVVVMMVAGIGGAVPAAGQVRPVGTSAAQRATTPAGLIAAYTLVAPASVTKSQLVARAVVAAGRSCPKLRTSSATASGTAVRRLTMKVRKPAETALPAFSSVVVCSRNIPNETIKATIGGRKIPAALPQTIKKIALVADTGCRVKGQYVQDCLSPTAWPMRAISEQIAREKPQVVLNPGDYYYRESACPTADEQLCAGTPPPVAGMPFTDSDNGWVVDVLEPMSPLFPVAPMALLRGNHEACDRGGNGFFLFFDPRPDTAATCGPVLAAGGLVAPAPATTPTWAADLQVSNGRTLRVAMVDSAYGQDEYVSSWAPIQRTSYEQAQKLTANRPGRESWLLTHRPIFSHVTDTFAPPNNSLWTPWTSLDQTAASQGLLGNYKLVLSSHVHVTQAVQIPGQPGSLIMGNGGTYLDPPTGYATPQYGPGANADGTPIAPTVTPYPSATMDWTLVQFGYAMAFPKQQAGRWAIKHRSPAGAPIGRCQLQGRRLFCS